MIGGDTRASAGSNRAAADHPPAQPLSLLAVLQQEFEELYGAPTGASATLDSGGPADEDLAGLYRRIHGLPTPRAALCRCAAQRLSSREHRRSVVQRIANGKLSRSREPHHRQDMSGSWRGGGRRSARFRAIHQVCAQISREYAIGRVSRSAQLIRGLPQVCVRTACLYVSTFRRGAGYSESRTIAIAVRASCWLFLRWPSVPIVAKERNFYGKIMVKLGPGLKLAANGRRLPMKFGFTLTDALITDYRLYATMAVLSWLDRAERYETVTRYIALPNWVSPWLTLPRSPTGTSKQRQTSR
jgi:hypothetical protein